MRRIHRLPLPAGALKYISQKQQDVNAGACVAGTWTKARRTESLKQVVVTLRTMAGSRERCMFCSDSRGADIDHFWPKVQYKERAFVWENLLLVCATCNSKKGIRFDLDGDGKPLLIDPTAENPWDYLFYEPRTGCITAKYDAASGQPNPKGQHSTDAKVLPLNIEAVTEGRQRTQRNILRGVQQFLDRTSNEQSTGAAQGELLQVIRDNDDYGLAEWFFLREGSGEPLLQQLKDGYPEAWKHVGDSLRQLHGATGG